MYDKEKYVVHTRTFKQALNHELGFKKNHRILKFNQKAWAYIDMNTKLRTEAKNDFERNFFKLISNSVLRKTMENVKKHRDFLFLCILFFYFKIKDTT